MAANDQNRHTEEEKILSFAGYKKSCAEAEKMLRNGKPDEVEKLLSRLEKKLKEMPLRYQ